jgi:DNA-binding Lrp family transcriptional regulator
MANSSYILARFSGHEKLVPAIRAIGEFDFVNQWFAVEGHVNLILKVGRNDLKAQERIKVLDGLEELMSCEVIEEVPSVLDMRPDRMYAFLFIETESTKLDGLKGLLRGNVSTVSCEQVRGSYDLVVVAGGEKFSDIDRIVNETVRPLDGILRLKVDKVINMQQI